jgi:RNA polymerase sigma-70 factor (ECF subfamily)
MAQTNDEAIIIRLQTGDHQAYTLLFEQHWKMVFDIAYRKTGDEQEALDLVQEVFTIIWEKRAQLTVNGPIAPWLAGMVKHKVIDWYRIALKREAQKKELLQQTTLSSSIAATPVSYAKIDAHWQLAISQLPERMKEIYLLHQVEGLAIADIAQKLSIQPQSVKNYLGKAAERIRKQMTLYLEMTVTIFLYLYIPLLGNN